MRKGHTGVIAAIAIAMSGAAYATDAVTAEPADLPPYEQTAITVPNPAPEFRMPVFKARKSCIRESGSRLRSRDEDGCRAGLAGKEISGKELNRTNWTGLR